MTYSRIIPFFAAVFHFTVAAALASPNLEAWTGAVTGNESVSVLVKMDKPLNLSELKGLSQEPQQRSLQIAQALEVHLNKEVEKQAPWLKKGPQKEWRK